MLKQQQADYVKIFFTLSSLFPLPQGQIIIYQTPWVTDWAPTERVSRKQFVFVHLAGQEVLSLTLARARVFV